MKKILLAIAVFGMIIGMSCENEDGNEEKETPNPFVGTWETENNWLYTFTDTIATAKTDDERIYYKGTYTYEISHHFYLFFCSSPPVHCSPALG